MTRIRTQQAHQALTDQVRDEAQQVAGTNSLISREEAKGLDPFLKRAEEAIRTEGGPGTRVTVSKLVARAASAALAGWERVNPPGHGTDSAYLSKAERAEIRESDPQLGALTDRAILRLGKLPVADPATAIKAFFEGFDFSERRLSQGDLLGGAGVDARVGQPARADVPRPVLDVFDHYYRAEDADWASVSLQRGHIAGQDVWVTYMTTDGDDEFLEVLDENGKALASGRLTAGVDLTWDAWPGRARLSTTFAHLGNPRQDEGFSEEAEAIAAGQIPPHDWPGDVAIGSGRLHPVDNQLAVIDLPASLTPEQRDVATAAFNLLWDKHFIHQGHTSPVELGSRGAGTMVIGSFTRPDDGKTYLVADWRDIDDASYTFYFEPGPAAPVLAIEQFNN